MKRAILKLAHVLALVLPDIAALAALLALTAWGLV